MSEIRKKLAELSNGETSTWPAKALWRRENRDWLKKSRAIAFEVLEALDGRKMTQKDLAELMNVSPQYVSNIVKGSENLTLETIAKLEKALGIQLMSVVRFKPAAAKGTPKVSVVTKSPKNKPANKKAA